jgi:hypothetical protein
VTVEKTHPNASRFQLRLGERSFGLVPGVFVLGRDESCDVVVDDTLASRRHAQLRVDPMECSLLDLASANGTWVNGERLSGQRVLAAGDWITLGRTEVHFVDGTRAAPPPTPQAAHAAGLSHAPSSATSERAAPTSAPLPPSSRAAVPSSKAPGSIAASPARGRAPMSRDQLLPDDGGETTLQVDTFQLFARLAERAFSDGDDERGTQILEAQFRKIVDGARLRGAVAAEGTEFMARYAVKLSTLKQSATWVDATIRVFTVARRPLPAAMLDELAGARSRIGLLDRAALRDYIDALRALGERLGAGDRILVQRIAALDAGAAPRT